MFSKALDCPHCQHRFGFDYENEFPERITCPACGVSCPSQDFSALIFCSECRTKLKIPVDMLSDPELSCPQCGTILRVNDTFMDNGVDSTYQGDENSRQAFRRMLQDGDFFDKYKIVRLLGKGGMAEVYLAEHLLLKQLCALKLMRSNMNSSEPIFVKRFIREAKISHSIDHPNIVRVFDAGNDFKTGYLFLAMEYVEGKTLLEISRERRMDEEELREILFTMTDALEVLERERVVHRDIKPSNIMLDKDGVYKLMDLGIAKSDRDRQDGELTLTMEQSTIGTPSYASPEQCQSAHSVDIRSDIYCLGSTIYHLATGKLPFDGTTPVEIILKVMQEEPEPLENYRPDLSGKFVKLIQMMMQKDPAKRPATPGELKLYLTGKKRVSSGSFKKNIRDYAKTTWKILCDIWEWLSWFGIKCKKVYQFCKNHFSGFFRFLIVVGLIALIVLNISSLMDKDDEDESEHTLVDRIIQKIVRVVDTKDTPEYSYKPEKRPKPQPRKVVPVQKPEPAVKPQPSAEVKPQPRVPVNRAPGLLFYCDFENGIPEQGYFVPSMIFNGVLNLDGIYPYSSAAEGLPIYRDNKANSIRIPRLDTAAFTFSYDLYIERGQYDIFLACGSLKLRSHNDKLAFYNDQKMVVETDLPLPEKEWVSISFSIDAVRNEFILYSGKKFVGVYPFNEKFKLWNPSFTFYDFSRGRAFKGKVDNIVIRNGLLKKPETVIAPEPEQSAPVDLSFASDNWIKDCEKAFAAGKEQNKNILIIFTDKTDHTATDRTQTFIKNLDRVPLVRHQLIQCVVFAQDNKITLNRLNLNLKALPTAIIFSPEKKVLLEIKELLSISEVLQFSSVAAKQTKTIDPEVRSQNLNKNDNVDKNDDLDKNGLSLQERLSACMHRLQSLRKENLSKLRNAKIAFVEEQIAELRKQIDYRRRAEEAKKRNYSYPKTENFRKAVEAYSEIKKDKNYKERLAEEERLLRLFRDPQVDPNLFVKYPNSKNYVPFWRALGYYGFTNYLPFEKAVIEKFADIKYENYSNIPNTRFLYCGLEYLGGKNSNIARILLSRKDNSDKYVWGDVYSSEEFRKYLRLAPEVNGFRDPDGKNLMHYAAERNDDALMIDLILAGFSEGKEKDNSGATPWDLALRRGSVKVAYLLEQAGLKTENSKKDMLQLKFCESMKKRNYPLMKKYLDDGADPYLPWYNNYNALQNACMMGDDELVEILLMEQVDPNKFIEHQRTYYSSKPMLDDPLWIAVSKDKKRIFSMLLYKGAEIRESQNRFQRYSTLPEFIIFHYRNDKDAEQLCAFLKLLVQHKWEINHINRRGKTILFSALEIFIPREVVRGDIIRFLLKNGADPRIRCNGIEPIQMARSPYVRKIFEDERR